MFWTSVAYAMGAGGQAGQESGPLAFVPFILMFVILYFIIIRPQQKRAKEHQATLNALKRGDKIITSGGLHGTIVKIDDDTALVNLGDSTVTINKGFISSVNLEKATSKKSEKKENTKSTPTK